MAREKDHVLYLSPRNCCNFTEYRACATFRNNNQVAHAFPPVFCIPSCGKLSILSKILWNNFSATSARHSFWAYKSDEFAETNYKNAPFKPVLIHRLKRPELHEQITRAGDAI